MHRSLIVIVCAAALAGCAPTFSTIPQGKTAQDLAGDDAFCKAQGGSAGSAFTAANAGTAVDVRNEVYKKCMIGKGYTPDK